MSTKKKATVKKKPLQTFAVKIKTLGQLLKEEWFPVGNDLHHPTNKKVVLEGHQFRELGATILKDNFRYRDLKGLLQHIVESRVTKLANVKLKSGYELTVLSDGKIMAGCQTVTPEETKRIFRLLDKVVKPTVKKVAKKATKKVSKKK